jgi:tRNA A37 methylthiotransferase MiaB
MGRHWYTASSYAQAVESIVRDQPVFGLGADVIAGFPGESDDDHRETMAFVQALPFTYLHVFPYSARPGTAATRLPGQVEGPVAKRRAADLRAAGEALLRRHRRKRAGGTADVVVVRGDRREGLTEDYVQVDLDGPRLPRGTRFSAHLGEGPDRLVASPVTPAHPA